MNLPPEIFADIARHLAGSQTDQASLACASHSLNGIVTPLLYYSVTLTSYHSFVAFSRIAGAPEPKPSGRGSLKKLAKQLVNGSRRVPQTRTSIDSVLFVRDLAIWCTPDEEDTQHRSARLRAIARACSNLVTLLVLPYDPDLNMLRVLGEQRADDNSKELHYINVRTHEVDPILSSRNSTDLPNITRLFLETEGYLYCVFANELSSRGRDPGPYFAHDPAADNWYSVPILRSRFPNLTHLVLACREKSIQYTPNRVALVVRLFLKSLPRLERLLLVVRHPVPVDNHNAEDSLVRRSDFVLPRLPDTQIWPAIMAIGDPRVYGVVDPTDPRLTTVFAIDEWGGAHGWKGVLWEGFVLKQAYSWESGIRMGPD